MYSALTPAARISSSSSLAVRILELVQVPVAVMPRVGCFSRAYMTPLNGGVEADAKCGGGGGGREPGEGGVDVNDDDTVERESFGGAASGASLDFSRPCAAEASEDS